MLGQVVEKEFPLWHLPKARHFVIVEANHEGGDEIEFSPEVRQRTESVNSLDYAMDTQESRNFAEHGHAVHIKTKSGMTEQLCNVEEISCAAAEIENPLRPRQIEFNLPNPADVDFDPTVQIEIFWPVRAGICDCVSLTNFLETSWIDCFDDSFCVQRKSIRSEQSERMFSCAGQAPAIHQFSYFVAESHLHTL